MRFITMKKILSDLILNVSSLAIAGTALAENSAYSHIKFASPYAA
jgi:hypothetical protein